MDTRDNDPTQPEPTEPQGGDARTEPQGEAPEPDGPAPPGGPQSPAPESPAGGDAPGAATPRRLTRSADDRVIAGVCGGIARYFKIDATLVRIGAVALTLFGGAGALLYLAALVLMPADPGGAAASATPGERPRALAVVAVVVLLLVG